VLGIEEFLGGLTGAALRERSSFGPTSNIAGIRTGYGGPGLKTVLPAEAGALLDFRLVPEQRGEEIADLLRAHLEREGFDDVELTVLGTAEAAGTPVDHPFVRRVAEIAEASSGATPSITVRVGGTLPVVASLQRHLGVPGLSPPDNPWYSGSRAHAPNENIKLDDVGHAVRFAKALLENLP
jgi:acetylornithine deacetylase/succinyl-diaminopimelate desuccinylase-like protein